MDERSLHLNLPLPHPEHMLSEDHPFQGVWKETIVVS